MILTGGRYFDSKRLEFYDNKQLWIEDGKILDIATRFNHQGKEVLHLQNYSVLPGWIDSHLHLTLAGDVDPIRTWVEDGSLLTTIRAMQYLQKQLQTGVTVIRDLGGGGNVSLQIRQALQSGIIKGPELLTSGQALTMTGGHIYQISREVDGIAEARKAAREELKKGVDLLKVIGTGGILTSNGDPGAPQLTLEEIKVIVEEGHKAGRRVAAHVESNSGIMNALQADVDTIEHGIGLDTHCVELLKSKVLIPTLAAPRLIVLHQDELPNQMVKKAQQIIEVHQESFKLAYNSGCTIAVGTDAGTPFNPHGQYYVELQELMQAGMKIEEVLRAASLNGAKALGIEERCGNIAIGQDANLTILSGLNFSDDWYSRVSYTMHTGVLSKIN